MKKYIRLILAVVFLASIVIIVWGQANGQGKPKEIKFRLVAVGFDRYSVKMIGGRWNWAFEARTSVRDVLRKLKDNANIAEASFQEAENLIVVEKKLASHSTDCDVVLIVQKAINSVAQANGYEPKWQWSSYDPCLQSHKDPFARN